MINNNIVIAGGGASGIFAAIRCRECDKDASITIVEKSDRLLSKVSSSGGGRCNLTHAASSMREFLNNYPRGSHFLRTAFGRFGPQETVAWFQNNGIPLETENDGRIFPASNRSRTVIDCLVDKIHKGDISILHGKDIHSITQSAEPRRFICTFGDGSNLECDRLLIATGGMRDGCNPALPASLGHTITEPVPSLFTFVINDRRISGIPGVSVEDAFITIPKTRFSDRGPLLITHSGISGPAVLRISAWAARFLHDKSYSSECAINWCPSLEHRQVLDKLNSLRTTRARSFIAAQSPFSIPARLWQSFTASVGISPAHRFSDLTKQAANELAGVLHKSIFRINGMDMNKKEFVTCGGVCIGEVEPLSMESKKCAGLFFAGEVLDIDGITGGFNLQAAWTTGWIAGSAMGSTRIADVHPGSP